jgi:hypothetical protein
MFASCSTDLELEAAWKDIPVAYGFLSTTDTAHYIRVEKAFLEPGGDALVIARNPDSLYYGEEAAVQLVRLSNGETFNLERVDGATEGYPREEGIFATQPNYLYKIMANAIQLKERERIQLRIDRGTELEPVTAETSILEEIEISSSSPPININWDYVRPVTFRWRAGPAARLFDLRLIIHIQESIPGQPGQFQDRSLVWILTDDLENTEGSSQVSFSVLGEDFYRFLAAGLEEKSEIRRRFTGLEIQVTGAGAELLEFTRVNLANSGITSSQVVPVYTNLSEGRGIFSSRTTALRTGLNISAASRDSLRDGVFTRPLNFQ